MSVTRRFEAKLRYRTRQSDREDTRSEIKFLGSQVTYSGLRPLGAGGPPEPVGDRWIDAGSDQIEAEMAAFIVYSNVQSRLSPKDVGSTGQS